MCHESECQDLYSRRQSNKQTNAVVGLVWLLHSTNSSIDHSAKNQVCLQFSQHSSLLNGFYTKNSLLWPKKVDYSRKFGSSTHDQNWRGSNINISTLARKRCAVSFSQTSSSNAVFSDNAVPVSSLWELEHLEYCRSHIFQEDRNGTNAQSSVYPRLSLRNFFSTTCMQ